MLPYIISLIVLAFTSKKSLAPKAEGIPYDKGSIAAEYVRAFRRKLKLLN